MDETINFCSEDDVWWKYAILPFIAGAVGYITNVAALKMMFYPIEFVGIDILRCKNQPFGLLGWQGVLPCKIEKIAGRTVDLILDQLLSVKEIFSRLDPVRFSEVMDKGLILLIDKIISETAEEYMPTIWNRLPQDVKDEIVVKASIESNARFLQKFVEDMETHIYDLLDIRHMAVTKCIEHKPLMNKIFLDVGAKEFRFIEKSGFYLGFLFGVFQMVAWCFYDEFWILPLFGFLVGWLTNWIALKIIFRPLEPKYFMGFKIHGKFLQRQKEVAVSFSHVVCVELIHTKAIWDEILGGPLNRNFYSLLRTHSLVFTDELLGGLRTFAIAGMGAQKFNEMKETVALKIMEGLPNIIDQCYEYTTEALDIENTIRERMINLSPPDFEGVLHPAFEEDEILLIIVGAALGLAAGIIQLFTLF